MSDNPFVGKWIYRSYLNEPSMPVFGEGTLTFDDSPLGLLAGKLTMPIVKPTVSVYRPTPQVVGASGRPERSVGGGLGLSWVTAWNNLYPLDRTRVGMI